MEVRHAFDGRLQQQRWQRRRRQQWQQLHNMQQRQHQEQQQNCRVDLKGKGALIVGGKESSKRQMTRGLELSPLHSMQHGEKHSKMQV